MKKTDRGTINAWTSIMRDTGAQRAAAGVSDVLRSVVPGMCGSDRRGSPGSATTR